ncbi:hypothetical protein RJ641_015561 [Dillenia turbinata]|uniref:Uncharacterized protein n=1 Tax=Dillenia turbinata TaxID=194707 RepID=A0AAN8UZ85_9MAGN
MIYFSLRMLNFIVASNVAGAYGVLGYGWKQMRKLEASLSDNWSQSGVKPTCHSLLPDTMQCVKDPPRS